MMVGTYTRQEKRDALVLVKEVGAATASRRLGMPVGTLHGWTCKARKAQEQGLEWPPVVREPQDKDSDTPTSVPVETSTPAAPETPARRVARKYTPSQRAEALELAGKNGVAAASKQLGISRFSIFDWRRKTRLAAEGKGPSPTSGPDPADVEARRDIEILEKWHEHPGLGPSQIRNQLRRAGIIEAK